jgi:hypothetical protein
MSSAVGNREYLGRSTGLICTNGEQKRWSPFVDNLLVEGIGESRYVAHKACAQGKACGTSRTVRYWGSPECPWRWSVARPLELVRSGIDAPSGDTSSRQEITLNEEEISDVNLATFYVFDKETPEQLESAKNLRGVAEALGLPRLWGLRWLQRLRRLRRL